MLARPDALEGIARAMEEYGDSIGFSVKMRLGVKAPSEALALSDILNSMNLRHVAVHPRTASQQYKGDLDLDALAGLTDRLRHPVIFNGEVSTPADIHALAQRYDGVMAGRGLLRRPTLFAEYREGIDMGTAERETLWMELIKGTASALGQRLCGEAQLRDKMKPYWEYAPVSMDRKTVKSGHKKGIIRQG